MSALCQKQTFANRVVTLLCSATTLWSLPSRQKRAQFTRARVSLAAACQHTNSMDSGRAARPTGCRRSLWRPSLTNARPFQCTSLRAQTSAGFVTRPGTQFRHDRRLAHLPCRSERRQREDDANLARTCGRHVDRRTVCRGGDAVEGPISQRDVVESDAADR